MAVLPVRPLRAAQAADVPVSQATVSTIYDKRLHVINMGPESNFRPPILSTVKFIGCSCCSRASRAPKSMDFGIGSTSEASSQTFRCPRSRISNRYDPDPRGLYTQ